MYNSCEEKNQHAKSFTNKNQNVKSSLDKISLTRRTINLQVSRREKPTGNQFHEQKSAHKEFQEYKISAQQSQ